MRKPVTVWYGGSWPMMLTRAGSKPISSSASRSAVSISEPSPDSVLPPGKEI
jgi:hypothetical protein